MTDAQEKVLSELMERGPLTWFRLDALLSAAGFQIGPALFAEIDALERDGYLMPGKSPHGPKTYCITTKGERLASYLAKEAQQHLAWLRGQLPSTDSGSWNWVTPSDADLRDTEDQTLWPRRVA